MPRNLKLVIEYDGTAYVGWERQKNGLGIQQVIEDAIFTITRERVTIHGSGRTDAGVHARDQVASFLLEKDIQPEKLLVGINAVSPPDISILSVAEVDADFHARRSARSKWYRYRILNDPAPRPMTRLYYCHFPYSLDVERMMESASELVGTHDFTAFAKEAALNKSCVRTILEARVTRRRPFIDIDVVGTGFLHNMVRIIAGTLIEIGQHRREVSSIHDLLTGAPRDDAGYTAPPEGLVLMEVRY